MFNNDLYLKRNNNVIDKIFIDDERFPNEEGSIFIVRNMFEFKHVISNRKYFPMFVTFDHDLGEGEPTGYDICKLMTELDLDNICNFPKGFEFDVHSQNPVGKRNIEQLLNGYLDFINNYK